MTQFRVLQRGTTLIVHRTLAAEGGMYCIIYTACAMGEGYLARFKIKCSLSRT